MVSRRPEKQRIPPAEGACGMTMCFCFSVMTKSWPGKKSPISIRWARYVDLCTHGENCSIWCGRLEFALEQFHFIFHFARQTE